jgi:hypothetical protein
MNTEASASGIPEADVFMPAGGYYYVIPFIFLSFPPYPQTSKNIFLKVQKKMQKFLFSCVCIYVTTPGGASMGDSFSPLLPG